MVITRYKLIFLSVLLLAGCGGHDGSGTTTGGDTTGGILSAVSTNVRFAAAGAMTDIYYGGVASSDFGALTAPTQVEVVQGIGLSTFSAYFTDAGGDLLNLTFTYSSGSTTSGTFAYASAQGAYAALSGTSGYFTLTPALSEASSATSTLRLSPKPIASS